MKNTAVRVYLCLALLWLASVAQTSAQGVPLVPAGSTWKYLDDGTDPGSIWRAPAFNDAAWKSGPAQLGFGDGDEATVVSRTNAIGQTNLTYYFRLAFTVADRAAITNLLVRLRRDDGAAVYLNDTEVFRSNLPTGPLTAATLALVAAPDDGSNFVANPVNPALLVNGINTLAVEMHQNAITSSDISFDLELIGNVQFLPPTIAITSPTNGASVASLNLPITVTTADPDGSVAMVEYFQGTTSLGSVTEPPFRFAWSNVAAGAYTLTAVALDSTGLAATSAPVQVVVPVRLVPSGSAWKYWDAGTLPGPAWNTPGHDDSGWPEGFAQLGFGDGDESTLLSRTNSAGTTNITYYFRHAFQVPNPGLVASLVVRVVRDDGAAVYLNGTEIFRDNLPSGTLGPDTLAVDAIDDARFRAARVNPALLVPGRNVLAVEVHQATLTSSDVSFDLELRPNVPPTPPVVVITAPTNTSRFLEPANVTISATAGDLDDRVVSVAFLLNGTLVTTDTTEPFALPLTNLLAGIYSAVAIATDESGNTTAANPVTFRVVQPPVTVSLVATGSVWRYFDAGQDLGTLWREASFDDSAWKSGPGKLGFSDSPATTIDIGPTTGRYLTTYFRHSFNATGAGAITNLAFRVLRDDGCVVYLNGLELFRMNMAAGPMSFTNRALTAIGGTNENFYYPMAVETPAGTLREGVNVLAVELHQNDPTSSDAGFDLGLTAVRPPLNAVGTLAIHRESGSPRIEWIGVGYILQSAPEPSGPFTDLTPAVTASPYNIPAAAPGARRFYRLREGP